MKAGELRIGNYVLDHGSVEKIQFGSDVDDLLNKEYIPLTEDWLVKFGSEQNFIRGSILFSLGLLCLNRSDSYDWGCSLDEGKDHSYFREIKYVHQLQNLYHAITGEELTFKK